MHGTPKILLVDDNTEFLNITQQLLQARTEYDILTLSEGSRTLEVSLKEKPDVIVLDVYMPDAEGPQVCRELKRAPEVANIPVLFLTAVGGDPRFRARCLEEGADDFLTKPANTDELIARLRVLLRIKSLQEELRDERDELERKVQARARELKEKETLAAIGKMVAGVAHEIRNPLGAISNSAAVLSRDLILEGEDDKLMDIIVRESERLRLTINEFLKFAHPAPYNYLPIDVRQLVEDVIMLARRDGLCAEGLTFELELPEDLPPVEIDQDRIHQVLWNLIRNALQAVDNEGEIRVTLQSEQVNEAAGIQIVVSDTGPGIPEEDINHIFDPFFTRKARGSGLGLAMVQSTVRAHNGVISVESNGGTGTIFTVWLPVHQDNLDGK